MKTQPETLLRLPTQDDVARAAGVSTATVSRVLNRRSSVRSELQTRVEEAIERLNYVPHAGARALALQRSGTLGAIIPTLGNAIFAEGIDAFERAAQSLGYTLLLSVSHQDPDQEQALVIKMIERGVDGLLLVGNEHPDQVFHRLERAGLRYVCTWAYDATATAANIGFDNAIAMHPVVDHLVTLGHQRVGMLAGIVTGNDRARDRVRGVRERLQYHGLSLPESHVVQVEYSIRASRRAFWQAIDNDITALVCGNDVLAFGALFEAQAMGLAVPAQLSITGFDDLDLAAELHPALTTVQVGAQQMGGTAARNLIAAVENQAAVASHRIDTTLCVRQSTGPCD
jgi:LacI family transcriptional regulator